MGDLQVVLGLWRGLRQQPDAAPEPSLEGQAPEPADAVADHADGFLWAGNLLPPSAQKVMFFRKRVQGRHPWARICFHSLGLDMPLSQSAMTVIS